MKIGCIVQARATSTRLPGKIFKIIDFDKGKTILDEVIYRLKLVPEIDQIIIATTTNSEDDLTVEIAKNNNVDYYRGSEQNVLERYYKAATTNSINAVVRITSDCPFVDPGVVSSLIKLFKDNKYDYASNTVVRTYPHGLDCQIASYETLSDIYSVAHDKYHIEHVFTYLKDHSDRYLIGSLESKDSKHSNNIRVTVDTKQDYALCCVVKKLIPQNSTSYKEIVSLFDRYPFLYMINDSVMQKEKISSTADEIEYAIKFLEKQELFKAVDILKKSSASQYNDI